MWQNYFDRIFLINLAHRRDRLEESIQELHSRGIQFEVYPAIYDKDDGARGLFNTMTELFKKSVHNSWNNILVLEDDIQIQIPNSSSYLDKCIEELVGVDWDLFYLGGNVQDKLIPATDNLFRCMKILSTHGIGYSAATQNLILNELKKGQRRVKHHGEPYDQLLERVVQPRGKTYIANKLVAVQRPSFSDILGFEIDYNNRIQQVFNKRLSEINK